MRTLQAKMIMSINLGEENVEYIVDYEGKDGNLTKMPIYEQLNLVIHDGNSRTFHGWNMAFPELMAYCICAEDKRLKRNVQRFHDAVRIMIAKARKNLKEDAGDLMSILLNDKLYSQNEKMLIDELMGMFFAGSATIQISTTNLICYLIKAPELKSRLLAEFEPALTEA